MARLTHSDDEGRSRMVDVGEKPATVRRAKASGRVEMGPEAFTALKERRLAKGDALEVARLAGIQAGKRTAEWIPLCHTVPLDHLDVSIDLDEERQTARLEATVSARWSTGVEMEALVAVSAAAMALYDMLKGVDRGVTVEGIRLEEKSGGRSGHWRRTPD